MRVGSRVPPDVGDAPAPCASPAGEGGDAGVETAGACFSDGDGATGVCATALTQADESKSDVDVSKRASDDITRLVMIGGTG